MLKKVLAAATIAGALAGGAVLTTAGPAVASGQLCYDIHVNAAPAPAVDQTGCQDLPA